MAGSENRIVDPLYHVTVAGICYGRVGLLSPNATLFSLSVKGPIS